MKNSKKLLSLIACLSLLSSCNKGVDPSSSCSISSPTTVTPTPVPDQKEDYSKYLETSLNDDGTIRINNVNDKTITKMIIPEEIDGKKVTYINYNAFAGCSELTYVFIPKTVDTIYTSKFTADVLLNYRRYYYFASPFVNCPKLEKIEVDKDNSKYYVEGNCLIEKTDSTTLNIICGFKDVVIPINVTSIRQCAFAFNSSVTSVKLHYKIYQISSLSFKNMAGLNRIECIDNPYFKVDGNVLYNLGSGRIFAGYGDVKIPDTIASFSTDFNLSNTYITSVDLNKVEDVGNMAFNYCEKLTKIKISGSTVKFSSFEDPNNKSRGKQNPFVRCESINSIEIYEPNENMKLVDNLDDGNIIGQLLYDKDGNVIYCGWGKVRTPETDNGMVDGELCYNYAITSITFNSSTNSVCALFSKDMKNLTEVIFENENGDYIAKNNCVIEKNSGMILASYGGDSLTELVLPNEARSIVQNAFTGLGNVTTIIFNEGFESMYNFNIITDLDGSSSSKLSKIVLPSTLKTLSKNFLGWKSNLKEVEVRKVEGSSPAFKTIDFKDNDDNLVGGIVCSSTNENDIYAGYGDIDLSSYKTIPDQAFYYNYSLSSVRFSNDLEDFGKSALEGTISLRTIYFNGTKDEFKTFAQGKVYDAMKGYTSITLVLDNGQTYTMSDLTSEAN